MRDIEKQRQWHRNYYLENKKAILLSKKGYYKELRNRAFIKLGGKCIYCGCTDYDALEINHINGGGNKESKTRTTKDLLYDIIKDRRNDLELACRVCNALHYLKLKGIKSNWKIVWSES